MKHYYRYVWKDKYVDVEEERKSVWFSLGKELTPIMLIKALTEDENLIKIVKTIEWKTYKESE